MSTEAWARYRPDPAVSGAIRDPVKSRLTYGIGGDRESGPGPDLRYASGKNGISVQ
jgi:hypothetical protein